MVMQRLPFGLFSILLVAACSGSGGSGGSGVARTWVPLGAVPIIQYQDQMSAPPGPAGVWNDPSVLKEGALYRMWLTSSDISVIPNVSIYEANSWDGITWTIDTVPQIVPGGTNGSWDNARCETPSVIEVGGTYHLYYSGNALGQSFAELQIGHATSPDGVVWTKDPDPVIPRPTTPNTWGWLGVAEPAITYKDGTFYLYYTMVRCRTYDPVQKTCTGSEPVAERGIAVAMSTDGTNFTPFPGDPILLQSSSYPTSGLYEGYSTPNAYVDGGGTFHLYYDVFQKIGADSLQVALAHATSADGVSFIEIDADILTRASTPWTGYEIRSPMVMDDAGLLKMWFAGNTGNDPLAPGFQLGIGHAEFK